VVDTREMAYLYRLWTGIVQVVTDRLELNLNLIFRRKLEAKRSEDKGGKKGVIL
jgi:hypothetical protein